MSEENNFLGEGFDFIEEATPFSAEPLEFQDVSDLDISESESTKSPWKLIGRVKGCMAPIGTYSRNHRIYENSHWIKTLRNVNLQERLTGRRLFGMPSHMQKPIDDEDFREGRISHIVSVLEVREDNNGKPFLYGEFDILDTPAGRILKAMYEGGAGIYVSTRAAGRLKPIPNDPVNKLVDSDSYYLSGIDCVLNPGFLQAKPAFEAVPLETPAPVIQESVQPEQPKSEEPEEDKEYAKYDKARRDSAQVGATSESSELQSLQSQISKLTKIIEKVVDDVYETEQPQSTSEPQPTNEEVQKQPIAPPQQDKISVEKTEEKGDEKKLDKSEALADFVSLMADTNISEKAFEEIIDMIAKSKENK